jgi:hypothetical protein
MRKQRKVETSDERAERLVREAQVKRHAAAEEDTAVERMIRRNIEQHGP